MNQITPEILRQLLRYDPETGKLFWNERGPEWFPEGRHGKAHNAAKWNAKFAGKEALTGTSASHGYRAGAILNRGHLAHRVAFALTYGLWPEGVIDHINGDRTDNRIANLREASQAQNCMNNRGRQNGRYIGVKPMKAGNFQAEIRHQRKSIYLGLFPTAEAAAKARDIAAASLRGEFACLNFPELNSGATP